MSSPINEAPLFCTVLFLVLACMAAASLGLIAITIGRKDDPELRQYVNFTLAMCLFLIPICVVWLAERAEVGMFSLAGIMSIWMIGVLAGRRRSPAFVRKSNGPAANRYASFAPKD